MANHYGYRSHVNQDGLIINVCGRQRETLDYLMKNRAQGRGISVQSLGGNPAEHLRQLAIKGVAIGRIDLTYADIKSGTGQGGFAHYYLLDDVRPYGLDIHGATRWDVLGQRPKPEDLPAYAGALSPFLGNINGGLSSVDGIKLLSPLEGTDAESRIKLEALQVRQAMLAALDGEAA